MSDGNNNADEALAQAKAKIEELDAKVEQLTGDVEKKQTIVDNAEKKFNEMAKETGDNRKAVAAAAQEIIDARRAEKEAQDRLRKLAEELAEAKKISGPSGGKEQSGVPGAGKGADEIEAGLTADEQAQLDEAWKAAPQELREKIKQDDSVRMQFLLSAKEAAADAAAADLSDWRKKPAQQSKVSQGSATEEAVKALFRKESKRARNLPDGSNNGVSRSGAAKRDRFEEGRRTNILMG